jgi:hypothetical protein
MDKYFDDDENVKAMRETAQQIGLTALLHRASASATGTTQILIRKALRLLGEQ